MFIVCLQLLRWKNAVLSSKTALYEDGWQKIPGSSSKTALYEDKLESPRIFWVNKYGIVAV